MKRKHTEDRWIHAHTQTCKHTPHRPRGPGVWTGQMGSMHTDYICMSFCNIVFEPVIMHSFSLLDLKKKQAQKKVKTYLNFYVRRQCFQCQTTDYNSCFLQASVYCCQRKRFYPLNTENSFCGSRLNQKTMHISRWYDFGVWQRVCFA